MFLWQSINVGSHFISKQKAELRVCELDDVELRGYPSEANTWLSGAIVAVVRG